MDLPHCLCGAWASPDEYPGAMWDRSEDWCPLHSPFYRKRTLARLRRLVKAGKLTKEQYIELRNR